MRRQMSRYMGDMTFKRDFLSHFVTIIVGMSKVNVSCFIEINFKSIDLILLQKPIFVTLKGEFQYSAAE